MPPSIENPKAREIFIKAMEEDQKYYDEITDLLFNDYYNGYLEDGLSEKEAKRKAEKEAIEDARYIFPNACETKIVFTMNARSLLNFFKIRSCERAQWEIRDLAFQMLMEVKKVYPTLFNNAGPNCINGPCPEGVMTCGKISEVRKKYKG